MEHGLFASVREGAEVAADGDCVVRARRMEGELPVPDPLGAALQPERGRRSGQYLWKQRVGGELRATQCDWESTAGRLRLDPHWDTWRGRLLHDQSSGVRCAGGVVR